ncbi:MAG: hypothetical protein LBQ93_06530 [Treponema sp.]|jgi:hypothetical protein|nr:hypothetical protein [Treponema sp.]
MHLQKTTANTVAGKGASEPSAKNVSLKSPSTQAVKAASTQTVKTAAPSAARSMSSIAASAGLTQDKLSSFIVSFARFFSLPLKPEQLAAIRRQAFASLPAQTSAEKTQFDTVKQTTAENTAGRESGSAVAAKNREALCLAAAAAESKGVELQPKGLESFAQAVDPDWQKRQDPGGQNKRQRNKDQNEQEENVLFKSGSVNASGLEKTAVEAAEENPLLYIMNRLLRKDGRRWIVLPFDFCEDGRNFRVSMRILLEPDQMSNRSGFMALDICETGDVDIRRLFVFESANNQVNRLSVFFQPNLSLSAHSSFKRELSRLLEIPLDRVFVKNFDSGFPFEEGFGDDLLRSIDEEI